jgi:hypothetical protein
MSTIATSFDGLSNSQLLTEVKRLAARERRATAELIACLAEVDVRRLYLAEGCASLFTYCTHVLHLSEHAAYGRIEAARAARRFPIILDLLVDGELTLTAVGLLAPHLSAENHGDVLASARHKSKREVEGLVAALRPRPDVPSSVRTLPAPQTPSRADSTLVSGASGAGLSAVARTVRFASEGGWAGGAVSEAPESIRPQSKTALTGQRAIVAPLAPERFKVQFTVSRETHDKLRRAQDLLRHQIPNGDPAVVFDRALTALLERLERTKVAAAVRPRSTTPSCSHTRYIPAAVRRAVWTRDGGRCRFVGSEGRCTETGFLEFHHVVPFAEGGATSVDNLEIRCRAHNAFEAESLFGPQPPFAGVGG